MQMKHLDERQPEFMKVAISSSMQWVAPPTSL